MYNDNEYTDGNTGYRVLFKPGVISTTEDTNDNDDIKNIYRRETTFSGQNWTISHDGTDTKNQIDVWQDPVSSDHRKGVEQIKMKIVSY